MENKSLKEFADLTASKQPTPGGGGVTALVGSLAACLAEMVCNLTFGKQKYLEYSLEINEIRKELEIIRNNLLECIRKDEEAFLPLAELYKQDKNSEGYAEKMEEALRNAANSPLLIFRYCLRIIEIDERLAVIGSKLSVSDAGTSVMLAHGCLYAAYINILVNTRLMKDRAYAEDLNRETMKQLDEYAIKALDIYDDICGRLEK